MGSLRYGWERRGTLTPANLLDEVRRTGTVHSYYDKTKPRGAKTCLYTCDGVWQVMWPCSYNGVDNRPFKKSPFLLNRCAKSGGIVQPHTSAHLKIGRSSRALQGI